MKFSCPNADGSGCILTGEDVLKLYSMDQYNLWQCACANLGIMVVFCVGGYVMLRVNAQKYLKMEGEGVEKVKYEVV
jgi:hypothetical protein